MTIFERPPASPLIKLRGNICAKLELFNPGGSHKSRSARFVVQRAIERGDLTPGGPRRILEKSGGNFGVGLALEARRFGISVDLVIGLNFSPVKRALCAEFGANLVGLDMLRAGLQPKEVITKFLADAPEQYFFTDQFSNPANFQAHLSETGPELVEQLRADSAAYRQIILVVAAGTGASASGIGQCLKASFPSVSVVLNEPERCSFQQGVFGDHVQKGSAVGVAPPFLDLGLIDAIVNVSDNQAKAGQRNFARDSGIYPGPSSGGNYFIAQEIARRQPDCLVATMIYDSGEGYIDVAQAA